MSNNTGVTRRRLVQGAAWSVPAIAIATPALAANCSPNSPCGNVTAGKGFKVPGSSCGGMWDKGYGFSFTFTNTDTVDDMLITKVEFQKIVFTGSGTQGAIEGPQNFTVPAGKDVTAYFNFRNTSSSNADISGQIRFTWHRIDGGTTEGPFTSEWLPFSQHIGDDAGGATGCGNASWCPPANGITTSGGPCA
ncbi:hypothetical protein [Kribbia dieselivorans]|uniref:hypothetical protein n=1 Tax=Kribbia dieselivorans TaxID=331526 RepID=UPI00083900A0|nr:hypothetical protein [Kribbia dieselivorans]